LIRATLTTVGPYCFQGVKFGQASASSNAYEPPKNGPSEKEMRL
jgi:hypothetical protein